MRPRREPLKNPKTDPGTILWLPASDHKNVIVGRPDQAVLVLVSEPTRTLICGVRIYFFTAAYRANDDRSRSSKTGLCYKYSRPSTNGVYDSTTCRLFRRRRIQIRKRYCRP